MKTKLAQDFKNIQVKYIDDNAFEVTDGIEEFERNMTRLGIDHVPEESERKKQKQNLQTEAAVTMAKIQDNKSKNVQAAKEKEIRQRKIHVEQLRTKKIDIYRHNSHIIVEKLGKFAYQIVAFSFRKVKKYYKLQKTTEEANKNIQIILENSAQKWGPIESQRLREIEDINAKAAKEVSEKKLEIRRKIIQGMKSSREKHYNECSPILSLILDVTEEAAAYLKNNSKIPEKTWEEWMSKFKNNLPPYGEENDSLLEQANLNDPEEIDEFGEPKTAFQAEGRELNEYLNAEGLWEATAVPNDEYLGDIIEIVMDRAYPADPLPALPPGPHYLAFKLLLLGPAFSGKRTQAKKLAEQFGLKTFEIEKIIEEAKKVVQKKNEPDDPKKKKQADEEPEIFIQTALESNTESVNGRSKLLRSRLRGVFGDTLKIEEEIKKPAGKKEEVKCQGFAVMGYPCTAQEAVDIEKELGGFVHPNELPESISSIKKRDAQIIAYPSAKIYPSPEPFRTVFDLVVWLDVDQATLIKRCTDRRIDHQGNIWNLTYNPPPDNILNKCKVIEKPTKEDLEIDIKAFNDRKEELYRCLSEFGDKWETLLFFDADQPVEAVFEIIKNKMLAVSAAKSQPQVAENNTEINFNGNLISLSQENAIKIAENWEVMKQKYLKEIGFALKLVDLHWERYLTHLQEIGNDFREFLQRPDEKEYTVNQFLTELNGIIKTKTVFVSSELNAAYAEIEELLDSLWDITDVRKQQAISHRENLMNDSPLTKELNGIMRLTKQLLQVEINKYFSVTNLIHLFSASSSGSEYSEIQIPQLKVNWKLDIKQDERYPVLEGLMESALKLVITEDDLKLNNQVFIFRCKLIESWTLNSIKKYIQKIEKAFGDLDIWITESVALENQAINQIVSFR